MTLLLALFGPSGSGKTTAAGLVERLALDRGWTVRREDVARPLHEVQHEYRWNIFGSMWKEDEEAMGQDRELMDFIWRRHSKEVIEMFAHRVRCYASQADRQSGPTLILNADVRDNVASVLDELGFDFVRVLTLDTVRRDRLSARDGLKEGTIYVDIHEKFSWLNDNVEDLIDNSGTLDELAQEVEKRILPLLQFEERRLQVKRENSHPKPRQEWARLFPDHPPVGCGDSLCLWGSPGGQHTNGGCRCLQNDGMTAARQELRRAIELVRALVKEREDLTLGVGDGVWQASDA